MSSTLLPFLYQTRTLQRAIRGPFPAFIRALHSTHPCRHPKGPPKKRNDDEFVPFDFGPDQDNVAASRRRRDPSSTITDSEKRVFDEIFGAISQRRKQLGGSSILPNIEPSAHGGIADEAAGTEKDEQELGRERILSMYPPALRRAAEISLGLQAEEAKKAATEPQVARVSAEDEDLDKELAERDEAAKVAQRHAQRAALAFHSVEKARMQHLMQDCASDTAVWELLEEHVFSMVERLGIGNRTPGAKGKGEKSAKRKGEKAPKRTDKSEVLEPLSMERYGPLYSLHLLSALRHLDRGFATPSPLALNVLPRVLELGMASYVLGVSTRFYNELMSIYWHRHGDAASVMRLLREMERAGLSPDGQTLKIVEAVTVALDGLVSDEEVNPFAEVLSTMQEYDSVVLQKLASRRKWVLSSMEERASELPM